MVAKVMSGVEIDGLGKLSNTIVRDDDFSILQGKL
jgi:hypothetical protein